MSVADLRHTLANLAGVPEPAIRAACKAVEQIAAEEGGSITMRRRGGKVRTYKLKAKTRIKLSGGVASATVWGTPTGFWVWKNTGTTASGEPIVAKSTKRQRRAFPMVAGHGHFIGKVNHKGITGRGAWRKVIRRSERVVPQIVANHVHRAVTRG